MSARQDDYAALAGEYVLGVLEEAELDRAEDLIATDRNFAREVAAWQARLAPLDAVAQPVAPDPALWQRIDPVVEGQRPPMRRRGAARRAFAPGLWDRIGFWRWSALAGAAWAATLAVIVGAMVMRWPSQPIMIAVLEAEGGRPSAVVETFRDGTARLIPLTAITVPEGRALQIWTLRDRQEGPISVGLIERAQSVRLDLGRLPAPQPDQLFEITLEPETGSPTGRPTGPVLMKGLTSSTL